VQAARAGPQSTPLSPTATNNEAWRLAAVLDGAVHELAAAWFASNGQAPMPTPEDLKCLCPGFGAMDYEEAIQKNILWARK
jgi:hypothetical protein